MSASRNAYDLAFLSDDRPLRRRNARWRLSTLLMWLRLGESAGVLIAGIGLSLLMPAELGEVPIEPAALAAGLSALVLRRMDRSQRSPSLRLHVLAAQMLVASTAGGLLLALLRVPIPTGLDWVAGELLGAGAIVAALRAAFKKTVAMLLADGRLATHIAVVGVGPAALRTTARLEATDPHLVHVVGRYDPGNDGIPAGESARGNLRTLLSDCRLRVVDIVVLAVEPDDAPSLRQMQAALRPCVQDVYLAADLIAAAPQTARVFAFGTTPLLLVRERPISGRSMFAKNALDQLGAWAMLILTAPLLLLIAAAIKLESPGPLLFRQLRVGYNNELFHVFKFRSMRHDATDTLAKQQTVVGDTRVTRVGRIIRRLSFDELPQLLNVVRGEMSLVGPRPHAPGTSVSGQRIHTLVDNYADRHLVRPGITGLAQVRGLRGGLQSRRHVEDRLASDLEYIETWSIWLDLRILVGTLALELRGSHGC